jgi:hypothetical protein
MVAEPMMTDWLLLVILCRRVIGCQFSISDTSTFIVYISYRVDQCTPCRVRFPGVGCMRASEKKCARQQLALWEDVTPQPILMNFCSPGNLDDVNINCASFGFDYCRDIRSVIGRK